MSPKVILIDSRGTFGLVESVFIGGFDDSMTSNTNARGRCRLWSSF